VSLKRRIASPSLVGAAFFALVLGLGAPLAAHEPDRTTPRRPAAAVFAGGPSELGMSEAQLRQRFGEALVPGRRSRTVLGLPEKPTTRLLVFHREIASSELAYAEYELFDGRVFRLRWCLAERFELPIFSNLKHQLSHYLSQPQVDKLVGKDPHRPAHEDPVLRYVRWRRQEHTLELRQINTMTGGRVFLTLMDSGVVEEIKAAHEPILGPPDDMEISWKQARLPSDEERWLLVWAFDDVLTAVLPAMKK
jgi:hypothetical protein